MSDTIQHASDRLHDDMRSVESSARRIMDSIAGEWGCDGQPFVPEICSAAQAIVDATGGFGHALEKAALAISTRADGCYIDRLGESTDATEQIRSIAAGLLVVAQELRDLPQRAYPITRQLGSIGQRETAIG